VTLGIELYWSFRSPYSYLATPRIVALAEEYDLAIDVRPVLPAAVRTPEFFERVNPLWMLYVRRDAPRMAEMLGLPFHWPRPDPVSQDVNTRAIAAEQPLAHRLTRLGLAAVERGRGLSFLDQVSRLVYSGTRDWDKGEHLAEAAARAGLSLPELDAAIAADPEHHASKIEANQEAQRAAGHWGVPLLVFEGEPFFGQDRIELCLWRLKQKGLKRRA